MYRNLYNPPFTKGACKDKKKKKKNIKHYCNKTISYDGSVFVCHQMCIFTSDIKSTYCGDHELYTYHLRFSISFPLFFLLLPTLEHCFFFFIARNQTWKYYNALEHS